MNILKKILTYSFFLFQINHFSFSNCTEKPLLVIISMVKNEEPVMEKTLKPFFDAGLQHYLILDTGSTDGTVQTVRNLFKKYKITDGYIEEKSFVDFATSRNHALECAEKLFPNAVFFLMIDAEWYFHNVAGLIKFCEEHKDNNVISFCIKRIYPKVKMQDYINWLFKADKKIRYCSVVHEYINSIGILKVPDSCYIECYLSGQGVEKFSFRWYKDLDMLLKQYKENPEDIHTMFILGQTYTLLKDYKKAIFWYKKRINKHDDNEVSYTIYYRIAILYNELNKSLQALKCFFKAYDLRPKRIEPLISIILYNLSVQNYYIAFVLAMRAVKQSIPDTEMFCIMPETYNFTRYYLLAVAAEHVGEYEIAQKAIVKALEYDPCDKELKQKYLCIQKYLQHKECNILNRASWCNWCNNTLWLSRPEWFNIACLSFGIQPSNRCNTFYGNSWRCWFGPAFV